MTAKLHQVLAVVSSKKNESEKSLTDLYKQIQKNDLFSGMSRTYRPKDEDGEVLPAETKRVQLTAPAVTREFRRIIEDTLDVVYTQDTANLSAKADIEIDGNVIISGVPATYLLYLTKRMQDFSTFINHLPTLDPSESWSYDAGNSYYKTNTIEKHRTKKVPKVLVKAAATDKHPAQTEVYNEDVTVGYWNETKFSGGLTPAEKQALQDKVRKLTEAIKMAREKANQVDAPSVKISNAVFSYIFGDMK